MGLPRWLSGKESACQCRRHRRSGFDYWVGNSPWRRKCQPTPVFLPGEFHGQRSLMDYSPRGCKELDKTEHACTGQQVLVECGKANIHVPIGSPCLQGSSWSWNSNQKLLSPTERLEPQEEQYVTHLAGEATQWLKWTLRRMETKEGSNQPWPPSQPRAQCLLSKQVRRGARRRLSLVAALLQRDAGGGWRTLFTQHVPWVQWVPCHSSPIVLLMKFHSFSSQWPLFSGRRHSGRVSGDRSQKRTFIPLVKNWASSGDALEAAFAMGCERQERAIMPEIMRPGAAQKGTSKTSAPIHSPVILLTESKILNMKGICFEFIWCLVLDFITSCLSDLVTFLFES